MQHNNGGHIIRYLRKKNKISQSDLAKKLLITQSMLSRIETGEHPISLLDFRMALICMGVDMQEFWTISLSVEEFESYLLYDELRCMMYQKHNEFFRDDLFLTQYQTFKTSELSLHKFFRPFIMFVEVMIDNNKWSDEYKINTLFKALNMSIPHLDENNIAAHPLTYIDVLMLNKLALIYKKTDTEKAKTLLADIIQNKDGARLSAAEMKYVLPKVCADLLTLYMDTCAYDDAVNTASDLMLLSRQAPCFKHAAWATYHMGIALHKLGKPQTQYMPHIETAYYAALALQQEDLAQLIMKEYDI